MKPEIFPHPIVTNTPQTATNNRKALQMIKQDYLIRMIQQIVSMIVEALLHKKKIRQKE